MTTHISTTRMYKDGLEYGNDTIIEGIALRIKHDILKYMFSLIL